MRKHIFAICLAWTGCIAVFSQNLAAEMQWRVQGVDTLPAWVLSTVGCNDELGVSEPGLSRGEARSQAIARAALCHLLHGGCVAQCVEEIFSNSEAGSQTVITDIRRMMNVVVDYPFDYQIRAEHVSPFGEFFCRVAIYPRPDGQCRIWGNMELFYTYRFEKTDDWAGYYQTELHVDGLDSVMLLREEIHRLQQQSDYRSWCNGRPIDKEKLYCTYADGGDTIAFEPRPMRRLVKGFWQAYILPHLDALFYEDKGETTIKSLMESYRGAMKNMGRSVSIELPLAVDTESGGIADNYLHIRCRLLESMPAHKNISEKSRDSFSEPNQ